MIDINKPINMDTFVEDCLEILERRRQDELEPLRPKAGELYIAKHSGRRCIIHYVSNWTLGVKWNENSIESTLYPTERFMELYTKV
jgi:hypothetical protein